jgi:hypothetical protein
MKNFIDKYFLQTTKYLVLVFTISLLILAVLIGIKWNKTLDSYGGYFYLAIAIPAVIFIYNRLMNKKIK